MVQHARLIFYSLLLLVIPCEGTLAQKIPVAPIDSLITVGYATGSLKTLSGSVEKITETQMNKDQITNPLEAIRGRVPGLTIQRGSKRTGGSGCGAPAGNYLTDQRQRPFDYRRRSIWRLEYAYLHLPYGY